MPTIRRLFLKTPNFTDSNSNRSTSVESAALLDGLVAETMRQVRAAPRTRDEMFGAFSSIASMIRSVAYRESALLEQGLVRMFSALPHLQVLKVPAAMPIVASALEVLKLNQFSEFSALRLDSEVHYVDTYKPDHLILNRETATLFIVDQKRNAGLLTKELLRRMMAAALTATDWLYRQGYNLQIADVQIAIIDCSDGKSEPDHGIFALSDIDKLFGTEGVADALKELRAELAQEVQRQLRETCFQVLGQNRVSAAPEATEGQTGNTNDPALRQQSSERVERLRRPKRVHLQPAMHANARHASAVRVGIARR